MLRIERILCPVDFSEPSAKAYDYAYSLAKHYQAELLVEHVVQPLQAAYPYYAFPEVTLQDTWSSLSSEAEKGLRQLVSAHARNGLHPKCFVQQGLPWECILSFAEEKSADLIVMGTHGRRGFDRLTMGSVTERVVRKARCPVLAVRKPAHDFVEPEDLSEAVRLRRILLATDFSNHTGEALRYAFSFAMEYNAKLSLLHVLEDGDKDKDPALRERAAKAAGELERLIPGDVRNWCAVNSVVRIGKPYEEIVQLAQEDQSDLVILGVRGRNALDLALFGSTTYRVIQLGSCPVLAIHQGRPSARNAASTKAA
jgi:nucleotide-binding universal stress UspA family protein